MREISPFLTVTVQICYLYRDWACPKGCVFTSVCIISHSSVKCDVNSAREIIRKRCQLSDGRCGLFIIVTSPIPVPCCSPTPLNFSHSPSHLPLTPPSTSLSYPHPSQYFSISLSPLPVLPPSHPTLPHSFTHSLLFHLAQPITTPSHLPRASRAGLLYISCSPINYLQVNCVSEV